MEAIVNNSVPVFTLTIEQLEFLTKSWIREVLQDVNSKKEEQQKYMTRLEVCKALNISLPTLSRYSGLGLIPAKRIGNRILYLEKDVENALTDIPTKKYEK